VQPKLASIGSPQARSTRSGETKAAHDLETEVTGHGADQLRPKSGELWLLNKSVVDELAATPKRAEVLFAEPIADSSTMTGVSMALPPASKRKAGVGSSKYAPLSSLLKRPHTLLKHAQTRAAALNEVLAKLDRQSRQYQERRDESRYLKVANEELTAVLKQTAREAGEAAGAVSELLAEREVFAEAEEMLAAAGLSDIPWRWAAAVVRGDISPYCMFARFEDSAMSCFEQSTAFTWRLSEPVKRWLAYALTQQSPAVSRTPPVGLLNPTSRLLLGLGAGAV
jgi:hypothetical protein